jgi:hypothetical protein
MNRRRLSLAASIEAANARGLLDHGVGALVMFGLGRAIWWWLAGVPNDVARAVWPNAASDDAINRGARLRHLLNHAASLLHRRTDPTRFWELFERGELDEALAELSALGTERNPGRVFWRLLARAREL